MRKIVYNNPISSRNESPLSTFFNKRLANQFSDARENPASHAYIVGTPNGLVGVPGKKNWIYIQRVVSGEDNVVLQCYVPGDGGGKTYFNWQAGMAITPKRSADTNPTYYYYTGLPPTPRGTTKPLCNQASGTPTLLDQYRTPTGLVLTDCIQSEFYQNPNDQTFNYLGSTYNGQPVSVSYLQNMTAPGSTGGLPDLSAVQAVVPNQADLAAARNQGALDYLKVPYLGAFPPASFQTGTLWDDGTYLRRYLIPQVAYSTTARLNWQVIRGPRTGIFIDAYATEYINRGQVVYLVAQSDSGSVIRPLKIATSFTDQGQGLILGIADTSAAKDSLITIQTAGMWTAPPSYNAFTPGSDLYLDGDGHLSSTIPPLGSGMVLQPMGTAVDSTSANIRVGTAIKRAGVGGADFISPFGSYPSLAGISGKLAWFSVDNLLNLRFDDPISVWPDQSGHNLNLLPDFSLLQDTRFRYRQSVFPGAKPGVSIKFGQSMVLASPVTGIKALYLLFNFDYGFIDAPYTMQLLTSTAEPSEWFGSQGPYMFYQHPLVNLKLKAATIKVNGQTLPYAAVKRPPGTVLMSIYMASGTTISFDTLGVVDTWSWMGNIGEILALDHVPDDTEEASIMHSYAVKWNLDYVTPLSAQAQLAASALKIPAGQVYAGLLSRASLSARSQ